MVTVQLFGMTKLLAKNLSKLSFELDGARQVKDFLALLETQYPELVELVRIKKVVVSLNQEIVSEETDIHDGDEVALLPPFAGGELTGNFSSDDTQFVRVQRDNFSVEAEITRVRSQSRRIGGISIFLGTARGHSKGRTVASITFEHYEGMAQKTLREIRARALKEFDIIEVAILHRYGEISVGDNIVLIVVGAEHRAEAFRACQWAIDELKQITPIWKLEHTTDGEVWVEEHP